MPDRRLLEWRIPVERTGKKFPLFCLGSDLLLRCWPATYVVLGLSVCKYLRDELRRHEAVILGMLGSYFEDINVRRCIDSDVHGLRDQLIAFRKPPELYLDFRRCVKNNSEDLQRHWDGFHSCLSEIQRARYAGSRGPGQLYMRGSGDKRELFLSEHHVAAIASTILDLKCLTILECKNLHMDKDRGPRYLFHCLPTLPALTTLRLGLVNGLSSFAFSRLCAALTSCPQLTSFHLCGISLLPHDIDELVSALSNLRLKNLGLHSCCLGSDGAVKFAPALAQQPSLENLWLEQNHISGDGAIAVARALGACTALKSLMLGASTDDDFEAEEFSRENSMLHAQHMNRLVRGVASAELASSLAQCSSLSALWVAEDLVCTEDGRNLAAVAAAPPALRKLALVNCDLGAAGAAAFSESLPRLPSLQSLWLKSVAREQDQGPGGCQCLCGLLGGLRALQHLELACAQRVLRNGLELCGIDNAAVLSVLAQCPNLHILEADVSRVPSREELRRYAEVVPRCSSLVELSLLFDVDIANDDYPDIDAETFGSAAWHPGDYLNEVELALGDACKHLESVDILFEWR